MNEERSTPPTHATNGAAPDNRAPGFDLRRDARGRLVFTDANGQQHVGVEPIRAFPLSAPRHGLALCDAGGRELLWIECLDDVPPEPRCLLEEEVAGREFVPILHRVVRISTPTEPSDWEVETDRGPTRFVLDSEDDVHRLEGFRAIVMDARGLRYLIPDLRELDSGSRALLERYV